MSEIDRCTPPATLAVKQPARVVASQRLQRTPVIRMAAPYTRRWALIEEANRLERRGEIQIVRGNPIWSHERGQWEILIRQLREPAPRWCKPAIVTGSVLMLLASIGWLLSTLSAAALAGLCLTALAGFCGWVWLGFLRPRRTAVEVTVNVSVKR